MAGPTDAITHLLKTGHGHDKVSVGMDRSKDTMTHLLKARHDSKVSVVMGESTDAMTHSLKAVHSHGKVSDTMDQKT